MNVPPDLVRIKRDLLHDAKVVLGEAPPRSLSVVWRVVVYGQTVTTVPQINHVARYREMAVGKSQLVPCLASLLVNK